MNAFQNCQNTSDAIPLYLPQQLYLKPICRLNISLQLPSKIMGKSVSNREVMEQLRFMIKPEEFSLLKVTKTNIEFIRFEAETETKNKLEKVVAKLNHKFLKLKDFPESMKLRASEAKSTFPTRHTWDTYFREAKNMNEMKPGERPDTVYISNLPMKWFVPYHLSGEDDIKPSEQIFFRVFEKFGRIRNIDIPICDPYRNKMKPEVSGMQIFDFTEENFFEGYVQFKDYIGFTKAMEALHGMKLMHKTDGEVYTVNISVDFDKSKHLSDASIRRREIVRDRLVKKEIEKEDKERVEKEEENSRILAERQKEVDKKLEKEQRRRQREEKRKTKLLNKLKLKGADEINEKILKEEKKLLKAQRKLEAIRLIEELFKRIKIKKEKNSKVDIGKGGKTDELSQFKTSSEIEVSQQRDKLNRVIEGRIVLKSILGSSRIKKRYDDSSSSDSSIGGQKEKLKKHPDADAQSLDPNGSCLIPTPDWYGYPSANGLFPYQVPSIYPHFSNYASYNPRNRGRGRSLIPGSSRGHFFPRRGRGFRYRGGVKSLYPPELHAQYYRYFEKFLNEHDDRPRHTYSRSPRSRSRSPRSRSRSRRKSMSKRSKSHSHNRSRSRSRIRSNSRDCKSKSKSQRSRTRRSLSTRSRSRSSNSKSPTRSRRKVKRRSTSKRSNSSNSRKSRSTSSGKRHEKRKSRSRQKSRSPSYKSIDSSKFISPSRLRMPRSKSWSLPKESNSSNKKSWSKSPSR